MPFEAAAMHAAFSAGDEQMSLIYSMLMSVDGYVEDEHATTSPLMGPGSPRTR